MRVSRPHFAVATAGLLVLVLGWPGSAAAKKPEEPIPALPLSIAVVREDGPVVDDAWITAQVAAAEGLFGAQGIHFQRVETRDLEPRFAHLETRADRDALAPQLAKGFVNVFVVASLRDVDDPSRMRMGVHWRPKGQLSKHYVIVSSTALGTTLAHELGHFLGNGHSDVTNNLMSYTRTSEDVFLDAKQVDVSRKFARLYVRTRELLPR
jgi:hypothetical protein